MGKLNYDDVIYQEDNKEELEMIENLDHDVSDKIKEKQLQELFKDKREERNDFYSSGFIKDDSIQFTKITVPKDYNPDWRRTQNTADGANSALSIRKRKLDANLRAEILGEGSAVGQNKFKDALTSKFDEGGTLIEDMMVEKVEDNLKGTKHLLVDIPFKNDKDKIQRFKNYIEEIENQVVIMDTSSNMMKGSEIRKEKEEFAKLYQLELALRKEKQSSGKYASEVVSSKKYREEISEDKQLELIQQLEKEKQARTVVTEWQPNALLCKRFGLLDPFKNKQSKVHDFNKNPSHQKFAKGRVEFVDQGNGAREPGSMKGDEFFYKIQRHVNRNEVLQKELEKDGGAQAMGSGVDSKLQSLSHSNYVDVASDSNSDMEGIEEIDNKNIMNNVISLTKRPEQGVFVDIFNSDDEQE